MKDLIDFLVVLGALWVTAAVATMALMLPTTYVLVTTPEIPINVARAILWGNVVGLPTVLCACFTLVIASKGFK